ncbi:TetR family transcriptional regulator [Nocardioides silvaticus]|uniref:TetR family transcriptional regulator n=1 Tax=Nocardioides silvaticus TaxID=2201891 RepID=A0A316TJ75_9ACTN|nr:TetR/AcrR family transcriptional regulator [Nocardioides silvaticus]PWN03279.1 TetR family transcriptional regulator [Nocardioides silvaticus]
MSDAVAAAARKRGERRRAQTRAALIRAAQQLLAEGRTSVPILEITELADVGMGSFYNHFDTKEELFEAAVESALELQGAVLDAWTKDIEDPAEVFARSFRLTGRIHRVEPQLSRVILSRGLELISSEHGLGPRALRDIERGCDTGRFNVADPYSALVIAGGAALALGQAVHDHPERDDAELSDRVTEGVLRMLGLTAEDAAAVCSTPLPSVTELLEEAMPGLQQSADPGPA